MSLIFRNYLSINDRWVLTSACIAIFSFFSKSQSQVVKKKVSTFLHVKIDISMSLINLKFLTGELSLFPNWLTFLY